MKTKKLVEHRYMFVDDDDGHWYLIEAKDERDFQSWLSAPDDYIPSYHDKRIDSVCNFTFTDPMEQP